MPTISVLFPVQPSDLGSAVPYARLAEATSGQRLWCGQSLGIETHHFFAALAGMGINASFGSCVTLMPMRHPLTAATCARSVAALSGQTYVAGIGPAAAGFQQRMLGAPYPKPIAATRRYVQMMRALLDGEEVKETEGPWATEGLGLMPMQAAPVEIGLGVLRAPMARLAGEVADRGITWLTPPGYLHERLVPALDEGAERAGRTRPRLAAVVHCAVERPGRDLAAIAFHSAGQHLQAPHYTDMLNQSGIPVDPADPHTGAALLVQHNVVATGSPEKIAETLISYHQAGVDEVIVNVAGVYLAHGPGAALKDLSAILSAAATLGLS
jgi:alkanesulfonate monooxygenase SsuD/methylene tetrahydromethanopterin reductase-like flavin-dependent oxidoreductase (luciferase family)